MFKSEVFSRTSSSSDKLISANSYNIVIGLTLLWGFVANWFMVTQIPTEAVLSVGAIPFLIGYFVSCFFGFYLFSSSDKPFVSFIGYNFVVVPFGFVLNIFLQDIAADLVVQAIEITALTTGLMMILGAMFPSFFERISTALVVALFASIIVELVMIFVFQKDFVFMDYIVAILFCGFIARDWARAQSIPKTLDNAVDSAAELYMSIINLFVRILSILKSE